LKVKIKKLSPDTNHSQEKHSTKEKSYTVADMLLGWHFDCKGLESRMKVHTA